MLNLVDKTFGWLKVQNKLVSKNNNIYWLCKCRCGNLKEVRATHLKNGVVKSCGCRKGGVLEEDNAAINCLYAMYRSDANKRNYNFNLSKAEFRKLTPSNCYYCGINPQKIIKGWSKLSIDYIYNGIDRINNTLGYELENCRSCCNICNKAKNDMTEVEFYDWVHRLLEFQLKIK